MVSKPERSVAMPWWKMARSSQGLFSSPWFLPGARQTILSGATAENKNKNKKKKKKRKSRTFGHLGQRAWGGIELDEEDEDEEGDDDEENEADDGLGGGGGDPFSTSHHGEASTINRGLFSYGQTPGMGFDKKLLFFTFLRLFVRQMATSC